jgi:SulP family sulfate permease
VVKCIFRVKAVPGSLIGLIIATTTAAVFDLDVKKIGEIPRTLPMPHGIDISFGMIKELVRPAIAIAALGAIESLLSAVVADGMTLGEKHNRELVGQGIANIVTPFFGGIPATGAIARTAVNVRNGGKTKLSGMLHAVFLLIIMFVFSDLAGKIPLSALAGILMMTSIRMVEVENTEAVLRSPRADIFVMLLTFFVTVAFDLVLAVEIGLMAAGILFVKRMSELGMIRESIETVLPMPESAMKVCPHVFVYRVDAPLFFGAADSFVSTIKKQDSIKVLILRLRRVTAMDATGAMALRSIVEHMERIGGRLLIAGLQPQPREVLERMGILKMIGEENIFERTDQAIIHAQSLMALVTCIECEKYINGVCSYMVCELPSKS